MRTFAIVVATSATGKHKPIFAGDKGEARDAFEKAVASGKHEAVRVFEVGHPRKRWQRPASADSTGSEATGVDPSADQDSSSLPVHDEGAGATPGAAPAPESDGDEGGAAAG